MTLGPPWFEPPTAWALNGEPFRLIDEPTVVDVAGLLMSRERDSGMWACLSITVEAQQERLLGTILSRERPVPLDLLNDAADDLLEPWLGMPRYMAGELWKRVLENWTLIDGYLMVRGVDLLELPLARACNAALAAFREIHANDGDRWKKWMDSLARKPMRVQVRETRRAFGDRADQAAIDNLRAMEMLNSGMLAPVDAEGDDSPAAGDSQVIL